MITVKGKVSVTPVSRRLIAFSIYGSASAESIASWDEGINFNFEPVIGVASWIDYEWYHPAKKDENFINPKDMKKKGWRLVDRFARMDYVTPGYDCGGDSSPILLMDEMDNHANHYTMVIPAPFPESEDFRLFALDLQPESFWLEGFPGLRKVIELLKERLKEKQESAERRRHIRLEREAKQESTD